MNKITPIILVMFFCVTLFSQKANAQKSTAKEESRPKIGLVLSGGGAKGLAHVGVLKVLEELGIKPDYITGVSMGSIVGGLYAIGYNAKQMDSIVEAIDWTSVFSDEVSFDKIGINIKPEYRKYQLNFSGDSLKGVGLPLGVVRGQIISEMFSDLCWRVNGIDSFDDFPIPFRCLATDLITGKTFTFKSGNLGEAMRASMSIPSAFTPIVKDTMFLVDGGVVNNFPVQECMNMGADIIIGVYVGSSEKPKVADFNSMITILTHSASILGVINAEKSWKNVDIKILPELGDYSMENFGKSEEIVQLGEDIARSEKVYTQLQDLAKELQKYPPKEEKKIDFAEDKVHIKNIEVKGLKFTKRDFVIAVSHIKENTKVSSKQIDLALKSLYSTLIFEKISYVLDKVDGGYNLVFELIEKDRIQANTTVYYDNFFDAGLIANFSYKHLLINSSNLDFTADISKFPRGQLAYHIYGGQNKQLFFTLGANAHSITIPNFYEFSSSVIVSLGKFKNNKLQFFASVGHSITQNSKLEFKGTYVSNFFYLLDGLENMYGVNRVVATNFSLEAGYHLNTLNHSIFPTKGVKFDIVYRRVLNPQSSFTELEGLFAPISNENEIITVNYKHYFRLSKRFSLIPEMNFGHMTEVPFYADKFFLGGSGFNSRENTYNQAGVDPYQIATDNFVKLGMGIQLKIAKNWYLSGSAEAAFFMNHAETYTEESVQLNGETISGWVGSIAYNSVIGPVKFTVSQNTNSEEFYHYFSIGFPF
ncbi:MAG: patatin-like phospholipase family protein [Bacteroidales bacterium]|nr:patatin-like phospholipase family protein [Bacteroidales bacterium]